MRESVFVERGSKNEKTDMFMFMSVNIRRSSSYTYLFSLLVWLVFVMGSRVRLFPYALCQTCLAKSVGVGKQQQQIGGNVWMVIRACVGIFACETIPRGTPVITLIHCPLLLYPQIHTFYSRIPALRGLSAALRHGRSNRKTQEGVRGHTITLRDK